MIYLNYTNLDAATQQRLLETSKKDVERTFGKSIKTYAKKHFINYEQMLEEEALRNLYNYKYVFNI